MVVTNRQIGRLRWLDRNGIAKGLAAAKAGLDPKTARKYRRLGKLPSEVFMEHDWRTRPDFFAEVWADLEEQLRLAPGLEAKTLFRELQRRFPGRFSDGQLRTLQRRIKQWRALHGPAKEMFFAQVHEPGRLGASDFTHCTSLGITIAGVPFPHLIYHFVLTYSNWESGTICFAESLESLSTGLQNALWELGGVPHFHRTDRLTAAIPPGTEGQAFTQRYRALLQHYGLQGQAINAGHGNENGDVEQSHHRFKRAMEQALLLRGSRDFLSRTAYEAFLRELFVQQNAGRQARLAEELAVLRPLPARRLDACKRVRVRVDRGSTIHVDKNVYSVAGRLIGEWVEARVFAERIEVWYAQRRVDELPRLRGRGKHRIEYRHVIDWLVRKPGAFADYRYRDDLFPTSQFRLAYDALRRQRPERADKDYLAILHLAARQTEAGVNAALTRLLAADRPLSVAAVAEELQGKDAVSAVPAVTVAAVNLAWYDALLEGKEADDGTGQERQGDAGGVAEGAAPADDSAGLRGAGATSATGGAELRAIPLGPGPAGMPGAAGPSDRAAAAGLALAAGEELVGVGPETVAGESAPAGADVAGGNVRGSLREHFGVRGAGLGENASFGSNCPGTGAVGTTGAVHDDGPAGAGAAGGQA